MSELKSESIHDMYWSSECGVDTNRKVYLKSEADKVIAELEESHKMEVEQLLMEIVKLKAQKAQAEDDCAYWEYKAHRERHNKYKRCLAMAMWCESTSLWCYQAACTLPKGFHATLYGNPVMIEPTRLFKRHELLTKWSDRWLELAEKFKEVDK